MNSDPLDRLVSAHAALERLPDAGLRAMLQGVVADLLAGADPRQGLGLTGGEHAALCRAHRDHHLRTAAGLLGESKRWRRSQRLAMEAARFEAFRWSRWRKLEHPPSGASEIHVALWQARRWGAFPGSDQQFHNITGTPEFTQTPTPTDFANPVG